MNPVIYLTLALVVAILRILYGVALIVVDFIDYFREWGLTLKKLLDLLGLIVLWAWGRLSGLVRKLRRRKMGSE